jgi:hypothetical protein
MVMLNAGEIAMSNLPARLLATARSVDAEEKLATLLVAAGVAPKAARLLGLAPTSPATA